MPPKRTRRLQPANSRNEITTDKIRRMMRIAKTPRNDNQIAPSGQQEIIAVH